MLKRLSRVLPLYLGTAVSAVVTLISIPYMIDHSSLDQWAVIGVGQTVGTVVAPLAGFGWAITGPAEIARAAPDRRPGIYRDALLLRLLVGPVVIVLASLLAMLLADSIDFGAVSVSVMSTALVAVDASFYYLGDGKLWHFLVLTVVPRVAGTLLGLMAMSLWDLSIVVVPLATVLGILLGVLLSTFLILRRTDAGFRRAASPGRLFKAQFAAAISGLAGGVFLILPTAIVRIFAPNELTSFVLFDRIAKQALTFVSPLFNYLQGWVPRGSNSDNVNVRLRQGMVLTMAISIGSLLLFICAGHLVVQFFSAGEQEGSLLVSLALGLIIATSSLETYVSRIRLVIFGRVAAMASIAVLGSMIGSLLVILLVSLSGAPGALIAIALTMAARALAGYCVRPEEERRGEMKGRST